jgi:hypothetical protein
MDKRLGPDDVGKRGVDDDDTEGQKVTRQAIPDETRRPDDAVKQGTPNDDEDDIEGQVMHR